MILLYTNGKITQSIIVKLEQWLNRKANINLINNYCRKWIFLVFRKALGDLCKITALGKSGRCLKA